jgi:fibronectin type 3 domain-containing protein
VPSLTATAHTNQVALTWTAPSDGGAAISGYVVRRGTASGAEATYTTLGAVTSYADTAVTPGVAYFYQVQAVNTVGTGAASTERTATPFTTAAAPTLSATTGKNQVSLGWTVPNSGGTSITGYQIYRSTTSGNEVLVQTISTGTSYIDSVPGGVTYYYRVAAVTAAGAGTLSKEVSVSPRR